MSLFFYFSTIIKMKESCYNKKMLSFVFFPDIFYQDEDSRPKCPRCFKLFKNLRTLRKHLCRDCGVSSDVECPFCPYRCKRKDNLKKHINNRHLYLKP